jgi:hypothetical protein
MKQQFTNDWATHQNTWHTYLNKFVDQPCKFLEIGCFEGRSAIFTIENFLKHPESKLYCFDPYEYSEEYNITNTKSSVEEKFGYNMDDVYERFITNVYPYIWRNKLEFNKDSVNTGIHKIRCHEFDMAYIDGSHIASIVLSDLVMIWPSMKTGSVLIIDDYTWNNHPRKDDPELWTPKLGIDAFLSVFRNRYKLLKMDYQVIIEKIC